MKKKLIILVLFLMTISNDLYCQSRMDTITTSTLNEQIVLVLKNKKLFQSLLNKDHLGDSAIFVEVTNHEKFQRNEPIQNDGFKTYYWMPQDRFFHNITGPFLRISSYSNHQYISEAEFLIYSSRKGYYVDVEFIHVDFQKRKKIPTVINRIEISKIRTIQNRKKK